MLNENGHGHGHSHGHTDTDANSDMDVDIDMNICERKIYDIGYRLSMLESSDIGIGWSGDWSDTGIRDLSPIKLLPKSH
jgi:hypothetical protein